MTKETAEQKRKRIEQEIAEQNHHAAESTLEEEHA